MSHWAKSLRRFFSVSSLSPSTSLLCPPRLNRCLPAYRDASIRRPEKNRPFIFCGHYEREVEVETTVALTITHACALRGSLNLTVMMPSGSAYATVNAMLIHPDDSWTYIV